MPLPYKNIIVLLTFLLGLGEISGVLHCISDKIVPGNDVQIINFPLITLSSDVDYCTSKCRDYSWCVSFDVYNRDCHLQQVSVPESGMTAYSGATSCFAGCDDPGQPPLPVSRSPGVGHKFGLGEEATYSCPDGTVIASGNSVRSCQSDGSWSGVGPTACEVPEIYTMTPPGRADVQCNNGGSWKFLMNLTTLYDNNDNSCAFLPSDPTHLHFIFKTPKRLYSVTIKGHNIDCDILNGIRVNAPGGCGSDCAGSWCFLTENTSKNGFEICTYDCHKAEIQELASTVDYLYSESSQVCEIIFN